VGLIIKGVKMAGTATFDLSHFVNNKVTESQEVFKLEKCPDLKAIIKISLKIIFIA